MIWVGQYLSVSFQIGPHLEPGNPLADNSLLVPEGDTKNVGVLGPENFLEALPAGGSNRIWEKTRDLGNHTTQ